MRERLLGTNLVLSCQRTDCAEQYAISVDVTPNTPYELGPSLIGEISAGWPEGWGWDYIDVNRVLHCPAHRTERAR